jgi:hypothetical protein
MGKRQRRGQLCDALRGQAKKPALSLEGKGESLRVVKVEHGVISCRKLSMLSLAVQREG